MPCVPIMLGVEVVVEFAACIQFGFGNVPWLWFGRHVNGGPWGLVWVANGACCCHPHCVGFHTWGGLWGGLLIWFVVRLTWFITTSFKWACGGPICPCWGPVICPIWHGWFCCCWWWHELFVIKVGLDPLICWLYEGLKTHVGRILPPWHLFSTNIVGGFTFSSVVTMLGVQVVVLLSTNNGPRHSCVGTKKLFVAILDWWYPVGTCVVFMFVTTIGLTVGQGLGWLLMNVGCIGLFQ